MFLLCLFGFSFIVGLPFNSCSFAHLAPGTFYWIFRDSFFSFDCLGSRKFFFHLITFSYAYTIINYIVALHSISRLFTQICDLRHYNSRILAIFLVVLTSILTEKPIIFRSRQVFFLRICLQLFL